MWQVPIRIAGHEHTAVVLVTPTAMTILGETPTARASLAARCPGRSLLDLSAEGQISVVPPIDNQPLTSLADLLSCQRTGGGASTARAA